MDSNNPELEKFADSLGIKNANSADQISILQTLARKAESIPVRDAIPEDARLALAHPENAFGRYIIVGKLGEGGMGAVYKAYDVELSRYVALKFIKSELAEELRSEAKTLAALEHRNIARVYDIGQANGRGFISMQLVSGKPIKQFENMCAVCDAIDYAHREGVIHRDIKPDNIMVDRDGNVFVMDFGLASKSPGVEIAGTPGYMAPEVAGGNPATARSDIYSIGATLYHLVSGNRPIEFGSEERIKTVIAKSAAGITKPLDSSRFPIELCAIVSKATAVKPQDRYSTAAELGTDLRNYLNGEPVAAFSSSPIYKLRKFATRRKAWVMTVASAIFLLAIAGILAYRNYSKNREFKQWALETMDMKLAKMRKTARDALDDILKTRKVLKPNNMRETWTKHELVLMDKYDSILSSPAELRDYAQKLGVNVDVGEYTKPAIAEVNFVMGRIRRLITNFELAKEFQSKALAADAGYAPSNYEMAVLMAAQYDIEYFKTAAQLREQRSQTVDTTGTEQYREPRTEEILAANDTLLEIRSELRRRIEVLEKANLIGYENLMSRASADCAKGIAASRREMVREAAEQLRNALAIDPELEEAHLELARIQSSPQEVEKIFSNAIAVLPGYFMFYFGRGNALFSIAASAAMQGKDALDDYKKSEDDFSTALMLNPGHYESLLNRASIRNNRGLILNEKGQNPLADYDAAETDVTEAIRLNEKHYEPWLRRGRVRNNRGIYKQMKGLGNPLEDFDASEKDISRSIELSPRYNEAWLSRGSVRCGRAMYLQAAGKDPLQDYKSAEEDWTQSIKLNAGSYEAWMNRGGGRNNRAIFLQSMGKDPTPDYKSADEDFSQAIKLKPEYAEPWLRRGRGRFNMAGYAVGKGADPMQDFSRAEDDLTTACRLNQSNPLIRFSRGSVRLSRAMYLQLKNEDPLPDFKAAEEDIAKALDQDASQYDTWYTRGWLKLNRGSYLYMHGLEPIPDYNGAEDDLTHATNINSSKPEAWLYRGNTHSMRAQFYEMKKEFPRAVEDYSAAVSDWKAAVERNPAMETQCRQFIDIAKKKAQELKDY